VPITMVFALLKDQFGLGIVEAAEIVGIGVAVIAIISLIGLRETFHVDLDYIETDKKPDKEKT
jgi:hypothetical protein